VMGELGQQLGATVIVDSRPGAGGQLAIELVKAAPTDGSQLLQTIGSSMVIYPHTYKSLRYRPFEDFEPVGAIATAPIVFVAANTTPADTLTEAVQLIKRDTRFAFYASPASGSVLHFSGVILQRAIGTELVHVPYKGSAPVLQDLMAGQVPFGFVAQSDMLELHRAGKIKVLAVTGSQRTFQMPGVPTFPELGYPQLVNREWFAYFLPSGTPAPVLARCRDAIGHVGRSMEVKRRLLEAGLEPSDTDPKQLLSSMRKEYGQWKQLVQAIGFVAD